MNFCAICGGVLDADDTEHLCSDCLAVSYSSMQAFGECPRRWYLEHQPAMLKAPAPALVYGLALHVTLECNGIAHIGEQPQRDVATLVATFDQCLEQIMAEHDPYQLLAPQYAAMRARGRRHLAAYREQVAPHYHPIDVEAPFVLPLPPLQGVGIKGIIDAMTIPQGKRTIVDFKTTTNPDAWTQDHVEQNAQATLYLMAERLQQHHEAAQRVTFIVFADRSDQTSVLMRSTTRTREQMQAMGHQIAATARAIRGCQASGICVTRPGSRCGRCQVLGSCPAGQRWLFQAGRTPAIPVIHP